MDGASPTPGLIISVHYKIRNKSKTISTVVKFSAHKKCSEKGVVGNFLTTINAKRGKFVHMDY